MTWTDISHSSAFYRIVTVPSTDRVYGTLKNMHESWNGQQIAYLEGEEWITDATQPVGVDSQAPNSLAVDAQGHPAIVGKESPRHIFHKEDGLQWKEYEGCSTGVEFSPNGTLYRLGCQFDLYRMKVDGKWDRISDEKTKVWQFAVNENGLWIIEVNKAVKKYEERSGTFVQIAEQNHHFFAHGITLGEKGQVFVINHRNGLIHMLWDDQWKRVDNTTMNDDIAVGRKGQVYRMAANKVYRQFCGEVKEK